MTERDPAAPVRHDINALGDFDHRGFYAFRRNWRVGPYPDAKAAAAAGLAAWPSAREVSTSRGLGFDCRSYSRREIAQ